MSNRGSRRKYKDVISERLSRAKIWALVYVDKKTGTIGIMRDVDAADKDAFADPYVIDASLRLAKLCVMVNQRIIQKVKDSKTNELVEKIKADRSAILKEAADETVGKSPENVGRFDTPIQVSESKG